MKRLSYLIFALYFVSINFETSLAEVNSDSSEEANAIQELFEAIEKINNKLDALEGELGTIQVTMEQKLTPVESKCLPRDVVISINNRRFGIAVEKLAELDDNTKIAKIVHDVYAGSVVNVDKIVAFAKVLKDKEAQFLVFSAVLEEMASSENAEPNQMIQLVEIFDRAVNKRNDESLKTRAKPIIAKAIENIKIASVSVFQKAMIAKKYMKNAEIENLANALFQFKTEVSNDVMDRVVDSVFGVVAVEKILDNISSHTNIPQVIEGLKAIFNRFNKARNLNNDAIFNLASHFRKLQKRENYKGMSEELKDEVGKVFQKIPTCARNLNIEPYVCLWNTGKQEYLYAAKEEMLLEKPHRNVYTWYPGDIPRGAFWHINRTEDAFYFRNDDHPNEYLMSPWNRFAWDKDQRYTYTLLSGSITDPQCAFSIELDGDVCYIKSHFNNEYLYASEKKPDQLNTYVFGWRAGTLIRSPEFQWQIRNCDQDDKKVFV